MAENHELEGLIERVKRQGEQIAFLAKEMEQIKFTLNAVVKAAGADLADASGSLSPERSPLPPQNSAV